MPSQGFKFLLDTIIPPVLITTGIITNLLVVAVYSRKKFQKLPTKNVWRLLSLVDIFCLLQITKYFTYNTFNFNLYTISPFMCKLVAFFTHSGAISAWLVVYISVERFFSILFPSINKIIRQFQWLICTLIFLINLLFYSQRFIYNGFYLKNNNTNVSACGTLPEYMTANKVFKWIDTTVSTIIPFVLMFICSCFLIYTIFSSRRRLQAKNAKQNRKKMTRDIKFSVTLVFLNIVFVTFKLPAIIYVSAKADRSSFWFSILDDLYYSCYAVNFFIYLMANSIFYQEFVTMIRPKKDSRRSSEYTVNS